MAKITKAEIENFLAQATFDLKPGQGAISFPIIERIHRRLQLGKRFSSIKVHEGIITDGHHRYICMSILGLEIETSKGGKNPSAEGFEWKKLNVEINDYDTEADIQRYEELYG